MFDTADATEAFQTELAQVLDAVTIMSPTAFRIGGGMAIDVAHAPAAPWGWQPDTTSGDSLMHSISKALYDSCYAHRLSDKAAAAVGPFANDPTFAQRLAQANAGRERWEPGWAIQQLAPNGQVFVRKGERERAASPGAFISATAPGMALQPGSAVQLRVPCEAVGAQPGYYFAFGETLDELAEQLSLMRLYFNCAAQEAAPLLGALTQTLNRFQVPFQMKTPLEPGMYGRTDAAVLYFGARYVPIVLRIVDTVRMAVRLAPSVPLFAKPIWPGVAAAADPGNGESFGMHRCRLTAAGIVQAWRDGTQDGTARHAAVAERFAGAGLDLRRPWLGPGNIDLFDAPSGRPTS